MYTFGPIGHNDIVFLGDSLTESFELVKHFGKPNLKNRGISGEMTEHILYRLEEIYMAKPLAIFLMIGINDLYQGLSIKITVSNIKKITQLITQNSPRSKLYIQSILPVNEDKLLGTESINTVIYVANKEIKNFCKLQGISFIDLFVDFLDNSGQLDSTYTYDGVHLNDNGYVNWALLIQIYINNLTIK